jgi:hypothetical protein
MSTTITIQGGTGDGNDVDASATSFAGDPSGVAGTVEFADTTPTTIRESEIEGLDADIVIRATGSILLSGPFDNNSGNVGDAASGVLALKSGWSLVLETSSPGGSIDLTQTSHGTGLDIVTPGGWTADGRDKCRARPCGVRLPGISQGE